MAAVRHWRDDGWETRGSYRTGGMTHTYWNCSRCHWCWRSLPLQANKKETPIQNTPLRGPMQHNLKCARSETLSGQASQATGGLPHPGKQLGSTAPILMCWPSPPCPQSPLSLPSPSTGTRSLISFHLNQASSFGCFPNPVSELISQG